MIWLDTETFSEINLKKVGSYRYAAHESTEVLLVPYAIGDEEPRCVDVDGRGLLQALQQDAPELLMALTETSESVVMHYSTFDRMVLKYKGIDIDTSRIYDTMVIAFTLGLPGGLDRLGQVLNLDDDSRKMQEGKKLIQRFCAPAPSNHKATRYDRVTHPEEWDRFVEYAMKDISSMRACYKAMPRFNLTSTERKIWEVDQRINDFGVRVDLPYVKNAIKIAARRQEEVTEEIKYLTWGAVDKHTKSDAIKAFCKENGVHMPDLQKANVETMLARSTRLPDDVRRLLELRMEANKATVSKYVAIGARTDTDGRLRGPLQYGGASRTLRWAGRGAQLHNMARPPWWLNQEIASDAIAGDYVDLFFEDPLDVVKGVVRGAFIPSKGNKFVISDLSNIEGRITAVVCGEKWKVQAFRDFDAGLGPDIYIKTYATTFGIPIDEVTHDQRQIGKVLELAGGYQGWVGAWETFAAAYGLDDTPTEVIETNMGGWRDAHPATRAMWKLLETAWRTALQNPDKAWNCGDHLVFKYLKSRDMLLIKLPSGRFSVYLEPRWKNGLCYKGMNDKNMWVTVDTYGGKILENLVQAIARDILAWALLVLDTRGFKIVLHVHDEVVADVRAALAEKALKVIDKVLSTPPPWAKGWPLAAKGFIANRYKKE